jgi:hypothetical protein
VVLWWLVLKLVVEPVEGLVSKYFLHHQPVLTFADANERLARGADAHRTPWALGALARRDVRPRNPVAHPFPSRNVPRERCGGAGRGIGRRRACLKAGKGNVNKLEQNGGECLV